MDVEVGSRVKVCYEAVVDFVYDIGLRVRTDDGVLRTAPADGYTVIEPPLQAYDVVRDVDGFIYQRTRNGGWQEFGSAETLPDSEALRPLTLLLRDGQPV